MKYVYMMALGVFGFILGTAFATYMDSVRCMKGVGWETNQYVYRCTVEPK